MSVASNLVIDERPRHAQRETICLSDIPQDTALHAGHAGFCEALQKHFVSSESNASERLIALKAKLRLASTHDFWKIILEEICQITDSQCGFVSKRILVEDHNTAVEMPALGEPGSCLMGIGFHLVLDGSPAMMYHDYQYHAYGTPCAYMKHDKVFIIPERMSEFIRNNPNKLPFKCEAYIGVPLFFEGKCFAHFGMIWSDQGAKKRKLSWGFIEMFLHSLEDMILQRILEGKGFAKDPVPEDQAKIIPLDAITASQSLKPYARSLSHELRTPMQGVVGMLDIMYSTVVGSIAGQSHEHIREIFEDLKENIEQAQDSSKRAVEAADAVVHAYDLNMQMPDTPLPSPDGTITIDSSKEGRQSSRPNSRPGMVIEGPGTSLSPKRKHTEDHEFHAGPPLKKLAHMNEIELFRAYDENLKKTHATGKLECTDSLNTERDWNSRPVASPATYSPRNHTDDLTPSHRHMNTRDFFQRVLKKSLENGHPEKTTHRTTDRGEIIEVKTRSPKGDAIDQTVNLIMNEEVPEIIVAEEAVLQLALHKVIDNAIKFSDESGMITVAVTLSKNPSILEIRISDQGRGITSEAQANLFKPFSQQDASMSRQKEGLGMGLYIAKARIRQNLGGDMILEKSEIDGPNKGSQFLIRLPISTSENDSDSDMLLHPPSIGTPNSHKHMDPLMRRDVIRSTTPQRTISIDTLYPISTKTSSDSGNLTIHTAPSTPLRSTARPRPLIAPKSKSSMNTTMYNPNLSHSHPLTFLVAEDNALNRKLLLKCLDSLGYSSTDILVAIDGNEAVELYKSSLLGGTKARVDVVLMDLWMPGLDGYEATRRIFDIFRDYNGDEGEEPVIMAVTADITTETRERAREVGMKGFLSKPWKIIDVQNIIGEHFRR